VLNLHVVACCYADIAVAPSPVDGRGNNIKAPKGPGDVSHGWSVSATRGPNANNIFPSPVRAGRKSFVGVLDQNIG